MGILGRINGFLTSFSTEFDFIVVVRVRRPARRPNGENLSMRFDCVFFSFLFVEWPMVVDSFSARKDATLATTATTTTTTTTTISRERPVLISDERGTPTRANENTKRKNENEIENKKQNNERCRNLSRDGFCCLLLLLLLLFIVCFFCFYGVGLLLIFGRFLLMVSSLI